MQAIIISGGPGAGKTSIINALACMGEVTFAEVSRLLIQQQLGVDNGILPWTNLPQFAALCLAIMAKQKRQAHTLPRLSFVDRAIGDICAYLTFGGYKPSEDLLQAAKNYHPQIYICTPREDIYQQNEQRPHSFAEALTIHQLIVASYKNLSYQVVEVPWGTPMQRARWILQDLNV